MTKLGPTGHFPRGKLACDDEGELNLSVTTKADGVVRIDFGPFPVTWIGLDPRTAIAFAVSILRHAGLTKVTIKEG